MALPKAYLTSVKNLGSILEAIQQAKAPERFTLRFLEALEFKASSDRLIIGVLKAVGLLDDQGKPTSRYFNYLDSSQSRAVLAEGIREAYTDLFQVNTAAQKLARNEVVNKFKTLSQGQYGEAVLEKMAMTFSALVKLADFDASPSRISHRVELNVDEQTEDEMSDDEEIVSDRADRKSHSSRGIARSLGGLHYNIQIILPDSRDPAVYDALFRSLREHLFQ